MKFPRFVRRSPLTFWSVAEPRRSRENLGFALAVSVYVHSLLLSLQFGLPGLGLPAMAFPWSERRAPAESLSVRLVEAPRPPAPAPKSAPVRLRLSPELSVPPAISPKPAPKRAPSRVAKSFEVVPKAPEVAPPAAKRSAPKRVARAKAPAAPARARERKIPAKPRPPILAQSDPQEETFKVPAPRRVEPQVARAPEIAAKKQAEEALAAAQAEEAARLEAEEEARQRKLAEQKALEAKKQEEAHRLELARKEEEARKQALELEARKLAEEAERQEAEALERQRAVALRKEQEAKKVEEARKLEEAKKKEEEEAKRLALEAEALKRAEEAARQQAEVKRKEQEAARRQAEEAKARAKEAAERQRAEAEAGAQRERERAAAAPLRAPGPAPTPGALSGKELAAKALEQLRASRIDPPLPPASKDTPRRRSLIGPERDVPLRMYVESWRWKIERNGPLNYRASASMRARENPVVTVSIRSDGSLEDVIIHKSSGVRELDQAVLRIARMLAPYSAFPPDLARQYDVIDIRRVWSFEAALKIMDEM